MSGNQEITYAVDFHPGRTGIRENKLAVHARRSDAESGGSPFPASRG